MTKKLKIIALPVGLFAGNVWVQVAVGKPIDWVRDLFVAGFIWGGLLALAAWGPRDIRRFIRGDNR